MLSRFEINTSSFETKLKSLDTKLLMFLTVIYAVVDITVKRNKI